MRASFITSEQHLVAERGVTDEGRQLLDQIQDALGAGEEVVVVTLSSWISPSESAKLLGVSRPVVSRLMDEGVLPWREVESAADSVQRHRRLPARAVIAYREMLEHPFHTGPDRQRLAEMAAQLPEGTDVAALLTGPASPESLSWAEEALAAIESGA